MHSGWWLIALSSLLTALVIRRISKHCLTVYRLPPGPWGLPILGYLPWLSIRPFEDFVRLGKQYGGIFSLRLGSDIAVVLNDWPTVQATLIDQGKTFGGRKFNHLTHLLTGGHDIVFGHDDIWRQQRNLTIQAIKKVSTQNKQSMESRFLDMIHQMTDNLKKLDGQSADIAEIVGDCMAQGNWNIISYIDVVESKAELDTMKIDIDNLNKSLQLNSPVGALNWLRFFPPNGFGFWESAKIIDRVMVHLKALVRKHYDQLDPGNDVIDHYIQEIKNNPGGKPPYNKDHLMGTVLDLIVASIETTTATCMWGLLLIALNPQVQEKVQKELERVVGKEHILSVNDFPNLPYLDAFVKEVHRFASVSPLSVPHSTLQIAHVNGYVIPKDTLCLQNIYAIHHDPDLWDEPEMFRPERFIAEDGSPINPQYLMPFSIGPRVCLGQFVAETELRLVFGSLFQRFTFSLPPWQPKPSLEPVGAAVVKPHPFQLYIKYKN